MIADLQHSDEAVALEGAEPVVVIAEEKQIAWKQRDHGADLPTLRRAILFENLRQEERDSKFPKLTRDCLLLAWPGVQAPPDGFVPGPSDGRRIVPEVWWKEVGLGGQNRHESLGHVGREFTALRSPGIGTDRGAF